MPQTQTLGAETASLLKVRSCVGDLVDEALRGMDKVAFSAECRLLIDIVPVSYQSVQPFHYAIESAILCLPFW